MDLHSNTVGGVGRSNLKSITEFRCIEGHDVNNRAKVQRTIRVQPGKVKCWIMTL